MTNYQTNWDLLRPAAHILADKKNKSPTFVYMKAFKDFVAHMNATELVDRRFHDIVSEVVHTRQLANNALKLGNRTIAKNLSKKWLQLLAVCASSNHSGCTHCKIAISHGNAHRHAHRHGTGLPHPSERGWQFYFSGRPHISWYGDNIEEDNMYNYWVHVLANMQEERARQINAGISLTDAL